ncbi:MAG: hypothetical protein HQ470_04135 [Methylophilales bacterium]|nr:hypothetical protein [Methylophilales bacterium]
MTSFQLNFDEPVLAIADFARDKCLTQDFFEWQLSNFKSYSEIRGNVFYDKRLLLQNIDKASPEGQIIGELLGYLGSERVHNLGLNDVDFLVNQSFYFPLGNGYEDLWKNFHKPSYVPPILLTYAHFLGELERLFKRGGENNYALGRLNELRVLLIE